MDMNDDAINAGLDKLTLDLRESTETHVLVGIRDAAKAVSVEYEAGEGSCAMQFAQAALNLANTLAVLKSIKQ